MSSADRPLETNLGCWQRSSERQVLPCCLKLRFFNAKHLPSIFLAGLPGGTHGATNAVGDLAAMRFSSVHVDNAEMHSLPHTYLSAAHQDIEADHKVASPQHACQTQ